jgi:hypothetical protein
MNKGVPVTEPMSGEAGATLTQAVEDLADAVKALRTDLGRRTRRLWRWILSAAAIGALTLTVVIVYLAAAVMDLRQDERAACVAFAGVGNPALLRPDASPLARKVVADHAEAARVMGCSR